MSRLRLCCMSCLRYCASSAALGLLVSRSGYTITYYVCAEGWGAACVSRDISDSITNPGVNAVPRPHGRACWPSRRHSCFLEGRSQPASSKARSRLRNHPVNAAWKQAAALSPKLALEFYPGRPPSSPWQRRGSSTCQRACPRTLCSTAPQKNASVLATSAAAKPASQRLARSSSRLTTESPRMEVPRRTAALYCW